MNTLSCAITCVIFGTLHAIDGNPQASTYAAAFLIILAIRSEK